MAGQIIWFEKNKIDLENIDTSITITDAIATNTGQDFIDFMRDRKNHTRWMTTGTTDAALTQIDIDMGDVKAITDILIIGHNFKNYTIQYRTGIGSFLDFSTTINPTTDSNTTTAYNFSQVQANEIRIIINGTQTVDAEKYIQQLIITDRIGQFEGWPQIKTPRLGTNKRKNKMLDGKTHILEGIEVFSCTLDVRHWRKATDIDILETIYFKREGVLMWINADTASQFFLDLKGYRKENIFLVRPSDDWRPEFVSGIYTAGIKSSVRLVEVLT